MMVILQKSKRFKKGFSMMEILLALLVVSIGVVAMIGLLSSSLDGSAKAHDDLHVVSFADMVFNYCHSATNWDDIATEGTIRLPDYSGVDQTITIGSVARFDCEVPNNEGVITKIYTLSYLLNIEKFSHTKELSLRIWPGFSTNATERIFYTEIYNRKKS